MPHTYTEDQLVEQPAGRGKAKGSMLKAEVLPPEAIAAAIDELTHDRSAMLLEQANREVYRLLKEGIAVSVAVRESTPGHTSSGLRPPSPQRGEAKGGQETLRVQVIEWEQPANNDFLLVSQFRVTGALYTCRPDLVG